MRILLLNDDFPPEGKSSVGSVAASLARGYRDRGHQVAIITSHRQEEDRSMRHDGDLWSIPVSYPPSLRHWRSLYSPRVSRMLGSIMKEIRPEVVHAHNIHTYLTYDALRIARTCTPQVFLTLHDVMSFSYSRLATRRYLASEGRETRLTAFDHMHQAGLQWNPLRNIWIRHVLRTSVKRTIAVSESLARAVAANGLPLPTVIHHGIDLAEWDVIPAKVDAFRERFHLQGRKVILFGGRLSLDKGVVPLLRAVDRLRHSIPNLILIILGEQERFQGMLEAAGVPKDLSSNIVVTGWMPREELPAAYANADVVTTPSLCLDTFNLMNLEAMAMSKPVVGTIFGGTPEVVVDGVTGFVRNPLDLPSYEDALRLLLCDDALARKMGEEGRKRANVHFALNRKVEEYLQLFAS